MRKKEEKALKAGTAGEAKPAEPAGKAEKATKASKAPPRRPKKGGTWKLVLLIVIVFIALVIGIIYLFGRIRKGKGAWGNPFESTQYVEEGSVIQEPMPSPQVLDPNDYEKGALQMATGGVTPTKEPEEETKQEETTLEAATGSPGEAAQETAPSGPTTGSTPPAPKLTYYEEPRMATVAQDGVLVYDSIDVEERSPKKTLDTGEELMILGDARAKDSTVWYLVEDRYGLGYVRKDRQSIALEDLPQAMTPTPTPEPTPEPAAETSTAPEEVAHGEETEVIGASEDEVTEVIGADEEDDTEVIIPPDPEQEVIEIG